MWYGGPYDPDDIDEKQICAAFKRLASASSAGRRGRRKGDNACHCANQLVAYG